MAFKKRVTGSKKLGCTASILLRECIRFPDYKVIEPKKKVLYFYNSLGETAFQQRHMLQNWKNFLGRTLNDNTNWRLEVPVHSKQTDGFNCGIYIVMFAENHILGLPCIFEKKDVLNKRKEIAVTLLLYEVNVKECCSACGWKPEGEEKLMRCGMCECYFHKKPHCVGEALHSAGSDTFICKRCEYNVE